LTVYINENEKEHLIMEKQNILFRTNLHFQTVAEGLNEEKEITEVWHKQYKPIPSINKNKYCINIFCLQFS